MIVFFLLQSLLPKTIRCAKYSLPSTTSIRSQNLDSFHICERIFRASISFFACRNLLIISRSWTSPWERFVRSLFKFEYLLCSRRNSFNFNVNGFVVRRWEFEFVTTVDVSFVFDDWLDRRSKIDKRIRNGRTSIITEKKQN